MRDALPNETEVQLRDRFEYISRFHNNMLLATRPARERRRRESCSCLKCVLAASNGSFEVSGKVEMLLQAPGGSALGPMKGVEIGEFLDKQFVDQKSHHIKFGPGFFCKGCNLSPGPHFHATTKGNNDD